MFVEARGRSAVAREVSAVVRGTSWKWLWNAVEVRGHCRGAPQRKRMMIYIPLFFRVFVTKSTSGPGCSYKFLNSVLLLRGVRRSNP